MDLALLDVIERALEPHGDGVAALVHAWSDAAGMWFVETTPLNPASAGLSAAFDGHDLVSITVGRTWFEVFPIDDIDGLAHVGEIASAVFGGNFAENAEGGFGCLTLPDGRAVRVGDLHLPLPWRRRRKRTYAPYRDSLGPA